MDKLWYVPKSLNFVYTARRRRMLIYSCLHTEAPLTGSWKWCVWCVCRCCHGNTDIGTGVLPPWSKRQISLLGATGRHEVVGQLAQVSENFCNSFLVRFKGNVIVIFITGAGRGIGLSDTVNSARVPLRQDDRHNSLVWKKEEMLLLN